MARGKHKKVKKAPLKLKRVIERLEDHLETAKGRIEEASSRADRNLHAFQVICDRERSVEEKLAAAYERIAELGDLVAAYEEKDKAIELLLEERLKELGFEERKVIEGGEEGEDQRSDEEECDEEGDHENERYDEEETHEEEGYGEERYGAEEHGEEVAHEDSVDGEQNVEVDRREYTEFVQYHRALVRSYNNLQKDHDILKQSSEEEKARDKELYVELSSKYDKEKESCQNVEAQLTECVKAKDELNGKYSEVNGSYKAMCQNYRSLYQRYNGTRLKEEESQKLLEAAKLSCEELSQTNNKLLQTHREMSLKYEEMEKTLKAAESTNQEKRDHIDGMIEDLLKLRIKWRTHASPV